MKRMIISKKWIIISIGIFICLCFIVVNSGLVKKIDSSDHLEEINQVYVPQKNTQQGMSASLSKVYENVQDLQNDAYAVVLGDVIKSDEDIFYNDLVHISVSDVKVLECYTGNINEGEIISIEETGCRDEAGDISIDGVPLLKENVKVLLFLTEPDNTIQKDKDGYGIIGVYQGKFFLDNDDNVYQSAFYSEYSQPITGMKTSMSFNEMKSELGVR